MSGEHPAAPAPSERLDSIAAVDQPAQKGPYLLMFRDQNSDPVHEVRLLTAGVSQTVSVTIDPSFQSYASAYSSMQALESVLVFAQTNQSAREPLRGVVNRIPDALKPLRTASSKLPGVQREFLTNKAQSIENLARGALAGAI